MNIPQIMPKNNPKVPKSSLNTIPKIIPAGMRAVIFIISPTLKNAAVSPEFSALRYSVGQLWEKLHSGELNEENGVFVNCDCRLRGLGTATCGPDVRAEYEIHPGRYRFVLRLAALEENSDAAARARMITQ